MRSIAVLFCFSSMNLTGQSEATVIVPAAVEQKFVVEHPDARATWKTEGANFKAQFINPLNNLGHITVYAADGTILRKEREMEPDEIPAAVSSHLMQRSKGQGFSVWSVVDSSGSQSFYSPHPEGVVKFDRDGKPVDVRSLLRDSVASPGLR